MFKLLITALVIEAFGRASSARAPVSLERFEGKFVKTHHELHPERRRSDNVKNWHPVSRGVNADTTVQYVYLNQYTASGECDTLHSQFIFGANICQPISMATEEYSSTQFVFVSTDDDSALMQYYYTDSACQDLAAEGTVFGFGTYEQNTCILDAEYSVSTSYSLPNQEGFYFQYSTSLSTCNNDVAFMTTWGSTGTGDDDFEDDQSEYNDLSCTTFSFTTPLEYSGYVEYNQTVTFSEQSTSESSSESSSSSKGCFAGTEMVMLESGENKPIAEIVRGDRVLAADTAGNTKFSTVIAVPHAANNKDAAVFVRLSTASGADILLTEDHVMMVQPQCDSSAKSELMIASAIGKGMCLLATSSSAKFDEVVSSVPGLKGFGVHTIITDEEFLVVNGFIASPFSTNHAAANAFYNVVRVLHAWMPVSLIGVLDVPQLWRALEMFDGFMSRF